MTMKKKLPVLATKPTPAAAQRDLSVKPVASGSRPEFPTRSDFYRKASLLGSATLLMTGLAHADVKQPPAKSKPPTQESRPSEMPAPPPPQVPVPVPAVDPAALLNGSVDGQPLAKTAPKFKVYRDGGGIGPAEDMWEEEEVEAFINWTMAREGKLAIQRNYQVELDGVSVKIDGFDPEKNVGYEYVDKLVYDREEITKEIRAKFDAWMKAKKVAILFIEIKRNPDAATIKGKVVKFLNAVKKSPPATGRLGAAAAIDAGPAPVPAPAPGAQRVNSVPAKPTEIAAPVKPAPAPTKAPTPPAPKK